MCTSSFTNSTVGLSDVQDVSIVQSANELMEPCFDSLQDEILNYMEIQLCNPKASYALASHESANFDSDFFYRSANMFSMGISSRKNHDFKVYNYGDKDHKSGYKTWQRAIDDFAEYQTRHTKLDFSTDENFIKSLKTAKYAVDPNHNNAVLKLYKNTFQN